MNVFDEPKIDCHNHVFDPKRFPYAPDTHYRPEGQETGSAELFLAVMAAHGVQKALVVGPNSGYGTDRNECLLDAIARSSGRMKGVAVVSHGIGLDALAALQSRGIVGVAFNPSFLGVDHYLGARELLRKLRELGMLLQVQVERDQLPALMPLLADAGLPLLIDHCGKPDAQAGLAQPGFQALLALGRSTDACVKLSGFAKFSGRSHPHEDAWPYVRALVEAFTLDRCVWGSDWPYLRATERIDYGLQLKLVAQLFPDAADRRKLFWETPRRLLAWQD
ncbi:amidohydrolase family protein [Variovorax sp. J22P168]|uniref:amidohydrolase family protein n=1 Tax=Variovorax jilinensis TaxID=3053513 RepID=UPI0025781057|nr:amidohydrolase family protein [Variovorax sp. J22P168]MDM0013921.1 amidohydrolase family protein [Variovorax sp. J22P168]